MALGLGEIVRRFGYARPTSRTISALEENRHRVIELAIFYDESLPDGHGKDQVLIKLQEVAMWANFAVTHDDDADPLPFDLPPGSVLG